MTSPGFVVLVVEDDVLTRIDVAGAFEASGCAVLEAAKGMVRPCSCPASDRSWQGVRKTRSTPCPKHSTPPSP